MITEGLTIAFPPELYSARDQALTEGRRWANALTSIGGGRVSEPWPGRWQVGDVWITLVEEDLPDMTDHPWSPWVGTCWTPDGYPDPVALIFGSRIGARRWVTEPIGDLRPTERMSSNTRELALFPARSGEYVVEAHLAKVVH
jgi:hypothetical protein